jgi:hypothetical protein
MQIVKCRVLEPDWKRRVGADGVINVDILKAKQLENKGLVEIIDKTVTPYSTKVQEYKTKIQVPTVPAGIDYQTKSRFGRGKKKIAWLQDQSKLGGAEISNVYVRKIGDLLGYDIVVVTPTTFDHTILYAADLIVINNFFEFDTTSAEAVYNAIYEKRVPYIKYDHDYREISKRLNAARQMFTLARLNVFISPEHKRRMVEKLGQQIEPYSIALPLAIDTDLYVKKEDGARVRGSVIIPTPRKCRKNMAAEDWSQYDRVTVIGNNEHSINGNVTIVPMSEPEKMVDLYNEHEYMWHKPDSPWAGERLYFESLLCGCKPVVNDNVGHTSWGFDNITRELKLAPFKFWSAIREVLHDGN